MKFIKNLWLIVVILNVNVCKTDKKNITNDDLPLLNNFKISINCPKIQKDIAMVFNVKDFGAVGDGITDDTKSIENCFDSIEKLGGGKVFF